MPNIYFWQAIRDAIFEEMGRDERVFVMGEDVGGRYGGVYRATEGLEERFGSERVRNTPISEAAIVGAAVGAAITGMRPIAEIMYMDWIHIGLERLYNGAGMMSYIHNGQISVPMVLRTQIGARGSAGPQHSQSLESWFLHIPGIKVVLPSTPYDGKGLLKAAIRDDNPVVFIEASMLYGRLGSVPEGEYIIELGKADIKKKGKDITLIAWSRMVQDALNAAEELEKEGISLEVLDPRTLVPLDTTTIMQSVSKTGKVIIYHEAMKRGGAGAEIAATINELCFEYLEAPIIRIGALEVPIPQSPTLEKIVIPNKDRIINVAKKLLE